MSKLHLEYFIARRIAANDGSGTRKNNVMVRIATISVAIGIAVMIVSLAVILGFRNEITHKLTGFGAHVQIVNLDGNSSYETIPISKDQPFLRQLNEIPGFANVHPYAINAGILRGKEATQGVVLKGVDKSYDWSFFEKNKVAGEVPRVGDTLRNKEVMISRVLADRMGLDIGSPMEMIFIQDPPRRDLFKVSGIYDTQYGELDEVMVLTDLRNVQRLNNWTADQVSGLEVNTNDFSGLDTFTDELRYLVYNSQNANGQNLRVVNLKESNPMIFDWLDAHNINAGVIITVMLLVALFNMISALLIILLERTSMIGVLKALGMGNHALQKMFIIRSSFILLKGMLWGNLVGIGLCLLQHFTGLVQLDQSGYFLTTVPILMNGWTLLAVNLGTFALLVALLSLPTLIISLILPEKSIRFE